jgi:hypothetical protein
MSASRIFSRQISQDGFQYNANAYRKSRNGANTFFLELRQRIELSFMPSRGRKFLQGIEKLM